MWLIVRLALVAWALLLFSLTASGQSPPIKIGLLFPYTGPIATIGQDATKGFELHLANIGGRAGGREIQLIKEDDEFKPDVGLTKTRKLVERDRVDLLVGPVNSAVALAIRDYINRQGVPLVVPVAFSKEITAPGKAIPWLFRVVETTDQGNFAMGEWIYKNTPHRRMVIMMIDIVAGHDVAGAFRAGFTAAGGEIVKEIYIPTGTADVSPYMTQVVGLRADAVYAFSGGADAVRLVKTYQEYGLKERLPLFAYNALVDDVLLPAIGSAALGIVSIGTYTAALDTPESRSFVRDYEAKYVSWPSAHSERGYVAAQLITAALDRVKGEVSDRTKVRDALAGVVSTIQPPRGAIRFDRYQQVITPVYITRVERRGNRLVNAVIDRIAETSQEQSWKWWNK
jgi:branched-chain amino acid transport system substrate-binding protein